MVLESLVESFPLRRAEQLRALARAWYILALQGHRHFYHDDLLSFFKVSCLAFACQ